MANKAGRAGATYRALTIGVSTFAGPYDPLRYAAGLADELRAELAHLGYACGDPVATDWTSEALGTAVRDAIRAATDDDVLIVHVLTHGDVGDATRKLYVIGTDGSRHDLADVEGWLTMVQDGVRPPLVLFVLDICEAGLAARLPWQGATADGTSRAWVIAACGPQEQAFDGWLTRATTTVLRRLRAGDLDIDAGVEFVPYRKIAQEIRIEVRQLAQTAENGLRQQVTGTLLDSTVADPYLPFFRNPAFTPNPLAIMRGREDPALASFTDGIDESATRSSPLVSGNGSAAWDSGAEGLPDDTDLSARHWADRTRGHGLITAAPDDGCFSGRTAELSELVPWMQGYQWTQGDAPRTLYVVTGGPGAGKSALLGVLVCAAHPKLRDATHRLWSLASQAPGLMPHLVAVHARQRDLTDVTACLAHQLASVLNRSNPQAGASTDEVAEDIAMDAVQVVAAVTAATGPVPVVVLDALDEAVGPQEIVDQLIVPLVDARRVDGTLACRVLVGSRRDGFEQLLDAARAQGGLIDLDETDRRTLLDDLAVYVARLLRTQPGYRDKVRVSGNFGYAVATALTDPPDADRRWGEFLVAGLYTHSVLRAAADTPISDIVEADRRGAACPRTLPEVLDLDLDTRPNSRELTQILQIAALARGAGIPASVIDRCRPRAPQFGPRTPILRALSELGFYLRRANDEDGTTLYRVFHEGLADYLRPSEREPDDDEEILLRASLSPWEPAWSRRAAEQALVSGMLRDLGGPGGRRWDLAEPYVLRHVLDHALAAYGTDAQTDAEADEGLRAVLLDPEFLVHADPSVPATLQRLGYDCARQALRILAAAEPATDADGATPQVRAPIDRRRAALALAAARAGDRPLAAALAEPPAGSPEAPQPWQPRWTAGSPVAEAQMTDCWRTDGGAVLQPVGEPLRPMRTIYGVACTALPDGTPVAVTVGENATVQVWDLVTHASVGTLFAGHSGLVYHLACIALPDGTPIIVTGGIDGAFRIWDLVSHRQRGFFGRARGVKFACSRLPDGRPIAIVADDRRAQVWDLTTARQLGDPLGPWPDGAVVRHLACARLPDQTPVAVITSDHRGPVGVSIWDLLTRREIRQFPVGGGLVNAFAATALPDGTPVAVAAGDVDGDCALRAWDISTSRPMGQAAEGTPAFHDIVCANLADGTLIAVTFTPTRAFLWDLMTVRPVDTLGTRWMFPRAWEDRLAGSSLASVASSRLPDGSAVVVTCAKDHAEVWSLPAHLGGPFWPAAQECPSALTTGVINGVPVVVLGTTDGRIEVRVIADGRRSGDFDLPAGARPVIRALGIGHEATVVSVDADGTVWATEASGGRSVASATKVDSNVVAIEAVPVAGRVIAALTGADNAITLIDAASGHELERIAPDETAITLAAADKEYRLIRRAGYTVAVTGPDGEPHGVLAGHTRRISTLTTMSLDGQPVAVTASFDGTVRFWDVPTLREVERLTVPGPVQTAAPAADGHLAVLCCGEVIIYARRQPPRTVPA